MSRRLSLRARLLLWLLALAAAGLAVADVATYTSLRSFLLARTDDSLVEARDVGRFLEHGCPEEGERPLPGTAPGDFVEVRDASGAVACRVAIVGADGAARPAPALPAVLRAPAGGDRSLTVGAEEGGGRYRVRISSQPFAASTLVLARPLDDLEATLRRLLAIELLVSGAVLAGLCALGLSVVRLGLRPLESIGTTAAAIAAGDLSRRVERAEPHTEVGRLGLALNAMLGQIEAAFAARTASERRLRRFVADASHELRTPLAAVRAYAELFERGASSRPDDLARAMAGIERESERMSLLVEDLLLLARLDEGRPLAREPVDLQSVVGDAVETARAVEPQRPLDLRAEPATVLGDRERLRQIVDNLLANVRTHTPPGTAVRVTVGRDDGHAVVEVADEGAGLAPSEVERVFERFYRGDPSRARASGGVGLGLALVAAVAEAHGGTASASSARGEGATFRISLPLLDGGGSR